MLKKILIILFILPCFAEESTKKEPLFLYQDKQTQFFGFKNKSGKVVIPAIYSSVYTKSKGPFFSPTTKGFSYAFENMVVVSKDLKYWWIDRTGKILYESFFFDNGPDYFHQGLSRIIENNKFGFINQQGVAIVKPQYDYATPFFLINSEGKEDFHAAEGAKDKGGYAYVSNGCWNSYPAGTKFPIAHNKTPPDKYPNIEGGKWGVISTTGKVVVELIYGSSNEAFEALKELIKK